ncbi:MAG: AhpC/TSA family protein [Alistipes sp.]|nr:AhpC/TSA family protein [Alistipes sp.]
MKKMIFALLAAAVMCGCNRGVAYTITVSAPEEVVGVTLVDAGSNDEVAEFEYDESAGLFTLNGKAEHPFIGGLYDDEGNPLTLVFVEKGDIRVDVEENGYSYVLSGTASNDAYNDATARFIAVRDEFYEIENPSEEDEEAFYDNWLALTKQLVEENNDNLYGAYILSSGMAMSFEPEEIMEYVNRFPAELRDGEILAPVKEYAEAVLKVSAGRPYTDISAVDAEGVKVALSSVVGEGKWVLVDFWATWCGPCRAELPYLKAAYEKYADKGFVIFGVSLDNNVEAWESFVEENGMTWINVIDLEGDSRGTAAEAYGVRSIPSNFLISPEGVITAVHLRGEGVESKLSEIFE